MFFRTKITRKRSRFSIASSPCSLDLASVVTRSTNLSLSMDPSTMAIPIPIPSDHIFRTVEIPYGSGMRPPAWVTTYMALRAVRPMV